MQFMHRDSTVLEMNVVMKDENHNIMVLQTMCWANSTALKVKVGYFWLFGKTIQSRNQAFHFQRDILPTQTGSGLS